MTTSYSGLGGAVENVRARAAELQKAWDEREFSTHYFDDHPVGDENGAAEQFVRDLDDFRAKNGPRVDSLFADLPGLFLPFESVPDPTAFRSLADQLSGALGDLVVGPGGHADFTEGKNVPPNAGYEQLSSTSTYLADWTGLAADQFRINVLPKVPGIIWNEFSAVAGLRGPLLAAENTYKSARDDLCKLVDSTMAQLDAVFPHPGGSLAVTLGLIGAVVGVVALPFTLGGSGVLEAGFAVATSAVGAAGAGASAFEESNPVVSGQDPEEIVQSMREALVTINSQIFDNELFASEKLGDLSNELAGLVQVRNPHPLPHIPADDQIVSEHRPQLQQSYTMPRPRLADTTRSNASDDQHVGRPGD